MTWLVATMILAGIIKIKIKIDLGFGAETLLEKSYRLIMGEPIDK